MSEIIRNFTLKPVLPTRFVAMNNQNEYPGMRKNCALEVLQKKLADLEGLEVVSVDFNGQGWYKEGGLFFGMFEHTAEEELPPYFIVKMKKKMPGDHVANMTAFLPTIWNERFFGVTGGGSASFLDYQQHQFALNTPWTVAIRNNFACVQTDCDIDFSDMDWGFKKDSTELDYDLIHYWGHIGAHDVAVIGYEEAEKIYEFGAGTFRDADHISPDLRRFRDAGKKLIITHASSDYCCPLRMTLRYYNNVIRVTADCSEEEASKFVKCYVSHGGGHGDVKNVGEIMAYPDTFIALVKWVEEGIEPGDLPTQKFDFEKNEIVYSGRIEKAYSISNPENVKAME